MTASVGFIMMCHTALDRAAQVARFWSDAGCPVVIHVDSRVNRDAYQGLVDALSDVPIVSFSGRFACDWGTWSLVAATQAAAEQMLARHAGVRHVYLASGACLPLRPVQELIAYLDAQPQTDFIESVTTADVGWDHRRARRRAFHAALSRFRGASSAGPSISMSGFSGG